MGAAGDERAAAAAPLPRTGRRQAAVAPRAAAAVYCMNEAELVDVALEVLAENLRCEEDEKRAQSGSEEEQELPPTPTEAPGSTAGTEGGSNHSLAFPSPPDAGAGADAERTGWEDSEDDALKYVQGDLF